MNTDEKLSTAPEIIIKDGMVIIMEGYKINVINADIFVSDSFITSIHPSKSYSPEILRNAEVLDASNCIVMPGLINTHCHTAMTLFRGYADDLPLKTWLFEKIFPAEEKFLNPDTVYWGTMLGALEMIASGTTCIADGYFYEDSTAKAIQKAGIRGLISQGVIDFPAPGIPDPKDNLSIARDFIDKWIGQSELITPGIFCHSPATCSEKTLICASEISSEYKLHLQIHLSETQDEVIQICNHTGLRPVFYLDQLNILNEKLIAAHSIHLNTDEINTLNLKEVKIVHVPESNMKLGSGAAKTVEMHTCGLVMGLGTDGCASNNNLDMFLEMDTASKLSKIMKYDSIGLNAKNIFEMATISGAKVLGLSEITGSIEVGKKADIIIVDVNSPHLCPLYDPISALVYSADGSDVRDVIINGKILYRNKEYTTLDPIEIIRKNKEISQMIIV